MKLIRIVLYLILCASPAVAAEEMASQVKAPERVLGLPLNGTGITTWGDATRNLLLAPQPAFPRQDADSPTPFSLTKLDATGKVLPDSALYWSCVRDNVTGLIWEGKTPDNGLHGAGHTYTWYNSNALTNGGKVGMSGVPEDISCGSPASVPDGCDTEKFVAAVNKSGWCGYKDWRMPTIEELGSIVNYGKSMPAIDAAFFPNMPSPAGFWSGSSFAPEPSFGWIVIFDEGLITHCVKSWAYYVRLVRDGH